MRLPCTCLLGLGFGSEILLRRGRPVGVFGTLHGRMKGVAGPASSG